jgi:D-psicose/D-tagatose/L-ribulose 3-epimerase
MLFGGSTWIWTSPLTDEAVGRLVPHAATLGFDMVELPLEGIDEFDYARAGALIRDCGLKVSAAAVMGPGRDLVHPDPQVRVEGAAYVRRAIEAAHELGATNLVGPIYASVGRTWQATAAERARDVDLLVAQLTALSAYAADHGVVLCIEPLNRFETSFINLARQAIEVVDRVDSPSCKVLLDTFHMNIEEQSLGDAIRLTGRRLAHLHACENDRGTPGAGHLPWNEVADALVAIGYDGPVIVETFTDKVTTIARAAAIWRPLAEDQDTLARDGVAFLRRLLE